jgi:hypothetical protein
VNTSRKTGDDSHWHKGRRVLIIRCHVCNADPHGRWKQPPAMIFCDRYLKDGSVRKDEYDRPTFVHACRNHLSAKREEEIQAREKTLGWGQGQLQ